MRCRSSSLGPLYNALRMRVICHRATTFVNCVSASRSLLGVGALRPPGVGYVLVQYDAQGSFRPGGRAITRAIGDRLHLYCGWRAPTAARPRQALRVSELNPRIHECSPWTPGLRNRLAAASSTCRMVLSRYLALWNIGGYTRMRRTVYAGKRHTAEGALRSRPRSSERRKDSVSTGLRIRKVKVPERRPRHNNARFFSPTPQLLTCSRQSCNQAGRILGPALLAVRRV